MNNELASEKNISSKQPKWLIFFRIALGFILFWKGISFIRNSSELEAMLLKTGINMFDANAQTISFIIAYAHLLGGFMILVGLFTRWASLIQIPIVAGAVIFVNVKQGMRFDNYELIISIVVLVLLILFAIKGSGVLSADEYFRNYYKAGEESGHTKKFLE